MSDIEFLSVVAMMRYHQKKYFKTRTKESLAESKRLEDIIDKEIAKRISKEDKGALKLAYAKYDAIYSTQPALGI